MVARARSVTNGKKKPNYACPVGWSALGRPATARTGSNARMANAADRDKDKAKTKRTARGKRPGSCASLSNRTGATTRSNTQVSRAELKLRARKLLQLTINYIYNDTFDRPDAEAKILGPMPADTRQNGKNGKAPKGLPAYLAELYRTPLLTKEQEVYLFRKMNYLKYRADQLRRTLNPKQVSAAKVEQIERLLEEAKQVRNQIVQANLRLVVSIAKRYVGPLQGFDELVSEGNISLIRAVECFDFSRGNKFGTYATRAINQNFYRFLAEQHRKQMQSMSEDDRLMGSLPDNRANVLACEQQLSQLRGALVGILEQLNERERSIVSLRFGLGNDGRSLSLHAIGRHWGVSKERIRQLLHRALEKLRAYAVQEQIEPPDDDL